jgi:chaperonin cofactor prefoldin
MEAMQGISLYSHLYLKVAKLLCLPYLTSRVDQIKDRILELEHKVDILAQSIEKRKKSMRSMKDHIRLPGQYWKTNPVNLV